MRLVLYTGKGGVGKTTTAAATAALAAARGRRTLVVSADAAHSLGDVLGEALGPEPRRVAPRLDALEVDARAETERHWGSIRRYLFELFRHQGIEELVADELAMLPGAEELTTLLAVEAHARAGRHDLVVVDCAPTDAALRLLTLPEVASGALRVALRVQRAVAQVVSPVARGLASLPLPEAEVFRDAESLLFDRLGALRARLVERSTSVRLVMTPERMVIEEGLRAHTDLALFELACDAVVLNRVLPEAAAREPFFAARARSDAERRAELEAHFDPVPVLAAPLGEDEVVGLPALRAHGEALFGERSPSARLARPRRLRIERERGAEGRAAYRVRLPLPNARRDSLEVARVDDALVVGTGARRRRIPLPRRLAGLELASARLERGALVARLVAPEPTEAPPRAPDAGAEPEPEAGERGRAAGAR